MSKNLLKPQSIEEYLAVLEGEDLTEYRKMQVLRNKLRAEAKKFVNLPPCKWPQLIFNWDLKTESQNYALDGVKTEEFQKSYPSGFCLAWVKFSEFDNQLCQFNRRNDEDEVWSIGCKSKVSEVIAYVARGLPITPILINVNSLNQLCLEGGNHRYVVAKFSKAVKFIPVYYHATRYVAISKIVTLHKLPSNESSSRN